MYSGSGKRTPWQLYSLPPNLSVCGLLISWCGAEGVTHHCVADVVPITLSVRPTMTLSVVWMGSVGHMVTLRPLLLWRHAKWSCTKLDVTYFYAAFVWWDYSSAAAIQINRVLIIHSPLLQSAMCKTMFWCVKRHQNIFFWRQSFESKSKVSFLHFFLHQYGALIRGEIVIQV